MEPADLVCPITGAPLLWMELDRAQQTVFAGRSLRSPSARGYDPVGPTTEVLVREDGAGAYPVVGGIPVLMAPEMLVPEGRHHEVDVTEPRYAEAYEEMAFYTDEGARFVDDASSSGAAENLRRILDRGPETSFAEDWQVWIDAKYEMAAQLEAYRHLRPVLAGRVLQVGGSGLHVLKFLLAGAAEGWLVSPMLGEIQFARALARTFDLEDRLHCVAALAEELPFRDEVFDAIFAQGSVHHWVTELAFPECRRVLRTGGRFAAVEPWRAPFYGLGTKVLGKRNPEVHCVVLSQERVEPFLGTFQRAEVVHHWALSRYPLIALSKLGLSVKRETVWRIGGVDDAVTARWPRVRDQGSSVALMATR
jgi:SAM-dependent methyltransferase